MALLSLDRKQTLPESGGDGYSVANRTASRDRAIPYMGIADSVMSVDELLADPMVPLLYSTYDYNPLCRLGKRDAVRHADNPKVWTVTLTYSTEIPKAEEVEDDNPLNAPVKRSVGFHEIQAPIYKDINGDKILMSNGLPFSPPITIRRSVLVFRFVKNYPYFDLAMFKTYHDHVNSESFMDCDPGTVYCQLTAEQNERKGYQYYTVTFDFQYDYRGWQPRPVHESLMCLPSTYPVDKEMKKCKDANGREVTVPWPLDEDGRQVPPSDIYNTPPYVSEVEAYNSADFNNLGLPLGA